MPLLTFPSPTGRPVPLSRQLKDLARHPFAGGALTAHMKVDAGTGERSGGLDAEGSSGTRADGMPRRISSP